LEESRIDQAKRETKREEDKRNREERIGVDGRKDAKKVAVSSVATGTKKE